MLHADRQYVGFNGNRRRKNLGYLITSSRGWLHKAGYAVSNLDQFLVDLGVLARQLGLIPVGIRRRGQQILSLTEMQRLYHSAAGHKALSGVHLRVFSCADFIGRWNDIFGVTVSAPRADANQELIIRVSERLNAAKISRRKLAAALEVDPSFLGKVLSGTKPMSEALTAKLQDWLSLGKGKVRG